MIHPKICYNKVYAGPTYIYIHINEYNTHTHIYIYIRIYRIYVQFKSPLSVTVLSAHGSTPSDDWAPKGAEVSDGLYGLMGWMFHDI